jgi:hypothetical protein
LGRSPASRLDLHPSPAGCHPVGRAFRRRGKRLDLQSSLRPLQRIVPAQRLPDAGDIPARWPNPESGARDLSGEMARTVVWMRKAVLLVVSAAVVPLASTGCWGGGDSHRKTQQAAGTTTSGVKLVPIAQLKGMCLQAASRVRFPIACPAALPRGSHPFWAVAASVIPDRAGQ